MRIWIDITNSPHVLFFAPVYNYFIKENCEVIFTARGFAQTIDILDSKKISYHLIGKHPGKNLVDKITDMFSRTLKLLEFGKDKDIDLCLSHNSHHLSIAAKFLNIPCINMFDYEHALSHHINIRLAYKIIIPSFISYSSLKRYGCKKESFLSYEGLKEQVYLTGFIPDKGKISELNLDTEKIIVTIRPPSSMAHYHSKPNLIYPKLLSYLSKMEYVQCIILPRSEDQINFARSYNSDNFIIPEKAVDAPNLIYYSDLVISGGGTINREAVVLGTPVYTIFSQTMGQIDKYLIKGGFLKELKTVQQLRLSKNNRDSKMLKIEPSALIEKINLVVKEINREV